MRAKGPRVEAATKKGGEGVDKKFTKEDFLTTAEPYEYLRCTENDPARHEQLLGAIQENAHAVGVTNFRRLYEAYLLSLQ